MRILENYKKDHCFGTGAQTPILKMSQLQPFPLSSLNKATRLRAALKVRAMCLPQAKIVKVPQPRKEIAEKTLAGSRGG